MSRDCCYAVLALAASALLVPAGHGAIAKCGPRHIRTGIPLHSGHIAFEGTSGDVSQLYIYSIADHVLQKISAGWSYDNPLNPNYSSDGMWLTFSAIPEDGLYRHVFVWNVTGQAPPSDLTEDDLFSSEDSRFSFDGRYLVFKRDSNIAVMELSYENGTISPGPVHILTSDGVRGEPTEASGPTMAAGNDRIFFFRGVHPDGRATKTSLRGQHIQELRVDSNWQTTSIKTIDRSADSESYYPVLSASGSVFLTRHHLSSDNDAGNDLIYYSSQFEHAKKAKPSRANFCKRENADAATAAEGYYFVSVSGAGHVRRHDVARYGIMYASLLGDIWKFPNDDPIWISEGDLKGVSFTPY